MDYEKAYNEALERARMYWDNDGVMSIRSFAEYIFPELTLRKDEIMRMALVKYFDDMRKDGVCANGIHPTDIIEWLKRQKRVDEIVERCKNSWYNEGKIAGQFEGITDDEKYQQGWHDALEKQGEKFQYWKPSEEQLEALDYAYNSCPDTERGNYYEGVLETLIEDLHRLEKQGEQKPADKVEPKFHEGDFVVSKITNTTYQIESVVLNVTNNKYGYDLTNGGYIASIEAYKYHLWTIEDAKDGDVLVDVYGNIGIFQKNDDFDWSSYCSLGSNGGFRCFAIEHELDRSHPATKEQRDLLFQKIKEAGYEWDFEKKELKLLITNGGDFESPTCWSKEDEDFYNDIIKYFSDLDYSLSHEEEYVINWLKSLKERLS